MFVRMAINLARGIEENCQVQPIIFSFLGHQDFDHFDVINLNPIYNPVKKYNKFELSKVRAWQLIEFDKIILLDADILCLECADFLFDKPELGFYPGKNSPINAGRLIIKPNQETYNRLINLILYPVVWNNSTFQGGNDLQGLLYYYFFQKLKQCNTLDVVFKHFCGPNETKEQKYNNYLSEHCYDFD